MEEGTVQETSATISHLLLTYLEPYKETGQSGRTDILGIAEPTLRKDIGPFPCASANIAWAIPGAMKTIVPVWDTWSGRLPAARGDDCRQRCRRSFEGQDESPTEMKSSIGVRPDGEAGVPPINWQIIDFDQPSPPLVIVKNAITLSRPPRVPFTVPFREGIDRLQAVPDPHLFRSPKIEDARYLSRTLQPSVLLLPCTGVQLGGCCCGRMLYNGGLCGWQLATNLSRRGEQLNSDPDDVAGTP